MTEIRREYVDILRQGLWGGMVTSCPKDVRAVLQLAKEQKTRLLVVATLLRSGVVGDEALREEMQLFLTRNIHTHAVLDHSVSSVVSALDKAGVPSVLLKGQGIARYYPEPVLRECGDIDLYVGEKDYGKACEIVRDFNGDTGRTVSETEKHLCLRNGQVIVEVHRHSCSPDSRTATEFWNQLDADCLSSGCVPFDFGDVSVITPSDSFNALYIFYHAWHHFTGGGLGLRQLCDWALFLNARSEYVDKDFIRKALDSLGLWQAWHTFGCIAVDVLGLPAQHMPFYEAEASWRGRYILDLMLEEGDFGRSRPYRQNRAVRRTARKAQTVFALSLRSMRLLPALPGLAVSQFWRGMCGGMEKCAKGI